jgi:4-hydroxybenzoate polyprenyltransferase
MESTSSADLVRFSRSIVLFNRFQPARYYAIDLAIFGFPLVLAAPGRIASLTTVLAVASMHFARLGGLVLDDYVDREADAVEAPHRPIPRRLVTPREALALGVGALLAGLIAAAFVGTVFLAVLVVAYLMLFVSFGAMTELDVPVVPTAATVTSVSMLSVLGWVAHGELSATALTVFLVTWSWDWAHDAMGDARDRVGDERAGISTVGVVLPPAQVAALASTGVIAAYALFVGLLWWQVLPPVATAAVGLVAAVPLAFTLRAVRGYVRGAVSAGRARRVVEWYVIVTNALGGAAVLLVAAL